MKKMITSIICIISMLFIITGCSASSEKENKRLALVICVGNHANSYGLNLNSKKLHEVVGKTVSGNGFAAIITIDGIPECESMVSYELPEQYANANPAKLESDAQIKTVSLLSSLSDLQANDSETDVLEALRLAVRALADCEDDYEKCIYIIDTGLSTTGILNFCNNLISADADLIAEELLARKAIPDFEGIQVYWQQLGDVAAPQTLTPLQVSQLKLIWKSIINKTGGQVEFLETPANTVTGDTEYPKVSVVFFPEELPIEFDGSISLEKPQFLSEEQCRFIGDSDQYVDPEQVFMTLSPIADYMITHDSFHLMLIGTTAGDDNNEFCLFLSQRRAEAVKNTLVEMGIDPDRIRTIGLGSSDPWHIYGVGTDSEIAELNRKVVLIDADSDLAKEVIE